MIILASAAAAIIPMFLYLLLIWKFDRYDREPFGLILKNYLWGAIGAIILTLIFSIFFNGIISLFVTDEFSLNHFDTIILAPFIEELMKGVFLFIMVNNRKFDNLTDGIVYGGAIGLGFGMTENFLYFITYASSLNDWIVLVIMRTLFSAAMHCTATASFGAFLSFAKYKTGGKKISIILAGFLIAMLIHFTWNFNVSFENTALVGIVSMLITFSAFIIVFSISVYNEKKIIYNELLEEVNNGLIPVEHILILNSVRRKRNGWIDESKRENYITAATHLAFRKFQSRQSSGLDKYYNEKDIEYYRTYIYDLLNKTVNE